MRLPRVFFAPPGLLGNGGELLGDFFMILNLRPEGAF